MMAVAVQTMTAVPQSARPRAQQTAERVTERPAALPALTGLRFYAALAVVLAHLCRTFRPTPALAALTHNGYVGVNLFFILSGFILAYSYLLPAGTLRGSRRAFYVARFARVYPVYVATFLLAVPPFLWSGARGGGTLALWTLTLVQGWLNPPTAFDVPAWSLSVEALFYLLFPFLGVALVRQRSSTLLLLAAVLWLGSVALAVCWPALDPEYPLLRVPEFALGIAVGCLYARRTVPLPGWATPAALGALLLVYLAGARLPLVPTQMGLVDPVLAAALFALAGVRGPRGMGRLVAAPALVALGEASYALYLVHWPLWSWYEALVPAPAVGAGPWLRDALLYVGLALSAAMLLHRLVEVPARRALCAALAR